MELKIYKCMHCGNIIEKIEDHGVPVICCGEPMKEFKAGETDGAMEKHVPVVKAEGDVIRACVGEVTHPMTEEHHIAFIWLVTDKAVHRAVLDHTGAPEAVFRLAEGEKAEAVYEFCNLHGLPSAETVGNVRFRRSVFMPCQTRTRKSSCAETFSL